MMREWLWWSASFSCFSLESGNDNSLFLRSLSPNMSPILKWIGRTVSWGPSYWLFPLLGMPFLLLLAWLLLRCLPSSEAAPAALQRVARLLSWISTLLLCSVALSTNLWASCHGASLCSSPACLLRKSAACWLGQGLACFPSAWMVHSMKGSLHCQTSEQGLACGADNSEWMDTWASD